MQVQVEETERGLAILIPAELLHGSQIKAGSTVDLTLADTKFIIAPLRRSKYTIEELMAGITDENMPEKINWGPPVGKEIW